MKTLSPRAEAFRLRREKRCAEKLRRARYANTVLAVSRAFPPSLPSTVRVSACGLPFFSDRKGVSLRYITGYSDDA